MSRAHAALPAVLAVAAIAVSGCTLVRGEDAKAPSQGPTPTQTAPAGMEGAARFYTQRLTWSDCSGGQCAQLEVPVDYAKPDGPTIKLAVLKVPSRRNTGKLGAIVVNPGGPGGSGVDYARAADAIVGGPVRSKYDIVGFDPRGVGRSAPVNCVSDAELDAMLGADPTPDDRAEEQTFAQGARSFAESCLKNAGPLLGHISTVDAAKDMDVLRGALNEPKLNYLGKSYGTFLGATYAGLFPKNVGRFVLDGVVAPDLTNDEINLGQAKGFELATRAWAASCVEGGDCPMGRSVDEVMQGLRDFLTQVDARPIPKTADSAVTRLTEGWASTGIAAAMYDQGQWATLVDALRAAKNGDGSDLMGLANTYADRNPGGTYGGNIMEVIYGVNCLDRPDTPDLAAHARAAQAAAKQAPTWGPFLMWSSLPCGYWPLKADTPDAGPRTISAAGSGPIVVVGTTRDPATPYEWSVRLRRQLANATLITYEGDGHTAYMRSTDCVNTPIDDYYVKGTVPKDGLTCRADG